VAIKSDVNSIVILAGEINPFRLLSCTLLPTKSALHGQDQRKPWFKFHEIQFRVINAILCCCCQKKG